MVGPVEEPTVPDAAEVARTTVLSAPVVLVRCPAAASLVPLAEVAPDGSLLLLTAERDPLVAAVRAAECGDLAAVAEASAVTSAPLPDRVLATVWLRGGITEVTGAARCVAARRLARRVPPPPGGRQVSDVAPGQAVLRLEVAGVDVVRAGDRCAVAPTAWAAARPDPFAAGAQDLVASLTAEHGPAVRALAALATAGAPALAGRPCAVVDVDRRGLRLRASTPGGAVDVRLAFPAALGCPDELPAAVAAVLERARAAAGRVRDCEG